MIDVSYICEVIFLVMGKFKFPKSVFDAGPFVLLLAFIVFLRNQHTRLAENGENLISAQPRISAHLE